jgi:UDP-glucuronate 4-epimerase
MRKVLVTGSSGFIGFHLCQLLLEKNFHVIGVDNMSNYYDVGIKERRQAMLLQSSNFDVINDNIEKPGLMMDLFCNEAPDIVIHLAAQAGVRHSIENPRSYLESNIVGTFEILEASRAYPPKHILLASTSSAYGANAEMPNKETAKSDHQISFYAATKKATENISHSYAHIYGLPVTMFRFFTVYGPWGRPDMALFKFTKAIIEGEPIDVYNYGQMERDFTYVKDLVKGIYLLIEAVPQLVDLVPEGDSLSPVAPWRVVNIGNSKSVKLSEFIEAIEEVTGVAAIQKLMPMQAGDVSATFANTDLLKKLTGYRPDTDIRDGVNAFVRWYTEYYNLQINLK